MTNKDGVDLCFSSIADLSSRIARLEISPVEVTDAVLRRIAQHDATLRAYTTVTADIALSQASQAESEIRSGGYRGTLHGIPVSLKDNIATRGIRTSCGSLVDPDWIPVDDATVYSRLRAAGAILVGKATTYEYAISLHPSISQPINPWHEGRSSLGSSSGSAVSVAAGLAYGSIGTDTGGSGRAPASANGVVGLKATYGRVSRAGIVPLSYSLDHTTMMARNVRDSALMIQATAGFDARDEHSADTPVPDYQARLGEEISGFRIGFTRGYTIQDVDADVVSVVEASIQQFEYLGATVREMELPLSTYIAPVQTAIMSAEAAEVHYDRLRKSPDGFGQSAIKMLDSGNVILATDYIRAQRMRRLIRDRFRELFQEFDLIIGPAMPIRVMPTDTFSAEVDGKQVDVRETGPEYTGIYNLTGLPAIVVMAGFSQEGTPIGLQIAGRWWDEITVLQAAYAFEQATSWHHHRPPIPDERPVA
jgi:aspartyl-tRNA(Asn)/glutamyl-tRNA(Gln) amidotransferase subunit A